MGALPSYANFDFANNLEVLEGSTISLFGPKDLIEVRVYDIIGESAYASVLYHEASQTLLTGDIVYNEVFIFFPLSFPSVLRPSVLLSFSPSLPSVLLTMSNCRLCFTWELVSLSTVPITGEMSFSLPSSPSILRLRLSYLATAPPRTTSKMLLMMPKNLSALLNELF